MTNVTSYGFDRILILAFITAIYVKVCEYLLNHDKFLIIVIKIWNER